MRLLVIFLLGLSSFISQASQDILTSSASQKIYYNGKLINNLAFSHDSQSILFTPSHENIATLHTLDGKIIQNFKHKNPILAIDFSKDGNVILVGTNYRDALLWSKTGEKLNTFSHKGTGEINAVAISPHGKFVLTASNNSIDDYHIVQLWKQESHGRLFWKSDWQVVEKLESDYPILGVSFAPEGDNILITSTKEVGLWKIKNDDISNLGQLEFLDSKKVISAIFFTQ